MPDPSEALTQSRTRWGIEIGGVTLAVTRVREQRQVGEPVIAAPRSRGALAAGALAGMSALTLLVVGASATRPIGPPRYAVSLPVPAPAPKLVRPKRPSLAPGVVQHVSRKVATTPGIFDPADEPYVAQAMATGAFQEWEDPAGQRRFLTAGPARPVEGKMCRDLALLVRLAEGGSRVRSAERCTTGVVVEAPPPDVVVPVED